MNTETKVSKQDEFGLEEIGSINSDNKSDFRTGSTFGAYFNIVCVVAGTGTLGLPYAMKEGGWIAVVFFVICAAIVQFTSKLLIECLYYKPGHRLEEMSDVGEAAFGKFGRYFTKVFQGSISLSSPCIYILLAGLNIHQMVLQLNNGVDNIGKEVWIVVSGAIILVPFCLMKTLKEVTVLAVFGALSTVIVVLIVAIRGGMQYNDPEYIRPNTEPAIWEGIPIALATISFSYGGNVVYPHVEATMKHPKSWNKAMFFAVCTITSMYVIIGITGYLYYGDTVQSPILDSLPSGVGSIFAYVLISLHVILAAPIFLCSFALEQERWLKIDRQYMSQSRELICRILLRGSIGIALTLIAMYVPYFSDLVGLFGAISSCIVIFLVPVICHYKIFGFKNRPVWQHFFAFAAMAVGFAGLILGSISSFKTLIMHIQSGVTSGKPSH